MLSVQRGFWLWGMAMGDVSGVNRYDKGATIGSGTFGIVFKAIDKLVIAFLSLGWKFRSLGIGWNLSLIS